ncbi:TPA: YpmS family protein [Streptococcus suis]|nr:YpmS family protein [Streptococcus suis]HEM3608027.1 YpmS family protein [Streptococcus suis]HEM3609747.1 YpmS family protein [Streptococcus suis]HEM3616072.1 YpmS family protein [Streptococcus suis]HEM3619631.1 YpmS family protein [Streptococcus suis]
MSQKKNGKINSWKWLFLILLAMVLGTSIVVISRLESKREDLTKLVPTNSEDAKVGRFETNKEQLNATIAEYLKEYQTDTFQYKVYLTSQLAIFEGDYQLLGMDIPLYIYFFPSRLEDGSISLAVQEISAGTLSLPKREVLTYLQKNYKLPDIVKIDAENATIQIQLPAIENKFGLYGKVNTIDLYNDQIVVDIYRKVQR